MGLQFGIFDHDSIRTYMDEYVATGANYCVCSFQWGNLTYDHAGRSLDLFVNHVMPHMSQLENKS